MSLVGLINANKPSGVTSRRMVDRVARLVRPAKVGHAGTLDPLAEGVLVIGVGQATRLVEYVQQMPKRYRAEFLLGRTSTTEDVEGEITLLGDAPLPSRAALDQAAAALVGSIEQRPPDFSALKVAGRRAYALARAGEPVDLQPRTVRVDRLEIVNYDYPKLALEVECGSGTYVRSLGRDLAERVGSGAVMSALVRTAIGPFEIGSSVDVDALTSETLAAVLLPPVLAVRPLMREIQVTAAEVARLANGRSIDWAAERDAALGECCAASDAGGRLIAILERHADGCLWPAKYFPNE